MVSGAVRAACVRALLLMLDGMLFLSTQGRVCYVCVCMYAYVCVCMRECWLV